MDKNLLLAVALSMGVYVAWFTFVERRMAPPAASAPPIERRSPSKPGAAPELRAAAPAASEPRRETAAPPADVQIHLPEAEARVSPMGGALSSYRFQGPLGLVELIPQPAPGFFSSWPELAFESVPARDARTVALQTRHPAGFEIRKEYRFGTAGELQLLRVELRNPGRTPLQVPGWELGVGPGLGTVDSERKENAGLLRALGLFAPASGRKVDRLETLEPGAGSGDWRWLAVDNRYFIAAVLPPHTDFASYIVERAAPEKAPALRVVAKGETLAPGAVSVHDIPFYLGPKAYIRLQQLNLGLERAVDFGWFDSVGRGILKFLHYLNHRIGNYGWSIIVLTVLLQILLFPLTLKSLKAAAAMKKLQPEMQRLQQKYANDPQRMNAELMALYKAKGANPLGGCLPMLLQLPIFVALFNALRNSWELHGSPWVWWVKDLSAQDPYYILPLIMGGVMFATNKINQVPVADPTQQKIMTYMPLIFTFMFLNFPSGLVLYWLTNSVLSAAQQIALKDRL